MSIPLIQKPDKDDINTSIIAIKRNIERINMLLGLVDSGSDPDLSGLATKQELQDAITELTPVDEVTVDNMQSVTSNAVASLFSPRIINLSFIIFGANAITKEAQIFYIGESETYKYYYFSRPLSTYSLTGMVTSNKQIIVYPTNSRYEIRNISLQFFQSANTVNSTITAIGSNSSPVGVRFYITSVGSSTSGEIGCFGIIRIAK